MMNQIGKTLSLFVFAVAFVTAPSSGSVQRMITNNPTGQVGIALGLAVIAAGMGIAAYVVVHQEQRLTDCEVSGPNGLQLMNRSDPKPSDVANEVSGARLGERIDTYGKKSKSGAMPRQFLMESFDSDLGPCQIQRPEQGL
jgi:hypothetical protein